MEIATTARIVRRRRRNRGGSGAGLQAPDIAWTVDIGNLLPVFSITYDARVGDIITIRRTQTPDFSTYEDASDAVESLDPPTSLEFDFGGDWGTGPWRVKVFYIRSGRLGAISDAITIVLETEGMTFDFTTNEASVLDVDTPANDYTGTPGVVLSETVDADGTYINSAGVITQKTANTIHVDHDPVTLEPLGIPCWEARTNLVLNSLINGTNLATQSVTVTAVAHTLSFYGTGTITLSGASTAGPLVGSGAYPTRSTLVFTPSAASLTLTVTGTVQFAQLEVGGFATPFIPTAGAAVARAADLFSIMGTAFPISATAWTVVAEAIPRVPSPASDGGAKALYAVSNNTFNESNYVVRNASSANLGCAVVDGGAGQGTFTAFTPTVDTAFKIAFAIEANNLGLCFNGTLSTDATATLPTVDRMYIGSSWAGTVPWCGHIKRLTYVPRRMTNTEIQTVTA